MTDIYWEDECWLVLDRIMGNGFPPGVSFRELIDAGRFEEFGSWAYAALQADTNNDWPLDKMIEFLAGKQRDYGPRNILDCPAGPITGLKVRLWDKAARYTNLVTSQVHPVNETLVDTLVDIVGYCAIALMVLNDTFERPLAPQPGDTVIDPEPVVIPAEGNTLLSDDQFNAIVEAATTAVLKRLARASDDIRWNLP